MKTIENGLYVQVAYTGTLENGEVFDASSDGGPLEVQMGAGQLIKGFEEALLGMALNETKRFTLAPEAAYGPRDESRVHTFARKDVPPEMDPAVGQTVALQTPDGHQIPARITRVDEESLTLDLNHPLAGEALTFDIEVLGITAEPTQAEDGCGCQGGCGCSAGTC